MMKDKLDILAIETEKFQEFLEKNDLKNRFEEKKIKCIKCGKIIISADDISYLYRSNGIKFVCNNNVCRFRNSNNV